METPCTCPGCSSTEAVSRAALVGRIFCERCYDSYHDLLDFHTPPDVDALELHMRQSEWDRRRSWVYLAERGEE